MNNLEVFHARVRELLHAAHPYDDGRRPTVAELADAIGIARGTLTNKLTGGNKAKLRPPELKAIVRTFVEWGAISTDIEVLELLAQGGGGNFTPAEWNAPPLDQLNQKAQVVSPLPSSTPTSVTQHEVKKPKKNNLPRQITSLIGREREIAEVEQLLRQSPLVTLVGAGGSGKTRLAIEVASRELERFEDGVLWVDLAAIRDHRLVADEVARRVGAKMDQTSQPLNALKAELGGQHLLLVLDNFEQTIEAAPLVGELLKSAPKLSVLVTSREGLGVYGEEMYTVMPLPLPRSEADLAEVQMNDAVRLFAARAASANRSFNLNDNNAVMVAEICAMLDGLPLAIELAAALTKRMPVREMVHRLSSRLALLVSSTRDRTPRQQSLRAAIDWSYDLLDADEQVMFRRIAGFVNGVSVAAASRAADIDEAQATLLLDRLVDKSLLLMAGEGEELRYSMLETIREYALDRLIAEGEADTVQQRQAHYYLDFATSIDAMLRGSQQAAGLSLMQAELDNIRASLGWTRENDTSLTVQIAAATAWFWYLRGYHREGADWIEQILPFSNDPSICGRLLNRLGVILYAQGQYKAATEAYLSALTYRRETGDRHGEAAVLNNLGLTATAEGSYAMAAQYHEQSLVLMREMSDDLGAAAALANLGNLAMYGGHYATAAELMGESFAIQFAKHQGGFQLTYYEQAETWQEYGHMLLTKAKAVAESERSIVIASARAALLHAFALYRQIGNDYRAGIVEQMLVDTTPKAKQEQ